MADINLKEELARQAEAPAPTLRKNMSIAELI